MPSRFETWLSEQGHELDVKRFPEGTRTAEDAARAVGCEVGQIVKSLVFVAGTRPVVALVSGANRVDVGKLSALAGAAVAKADAETVRTATGYAIGGVPPFGHTEALAIFMDRDLLQYQTVWAAAGRPDSVFSIGPGRLIDVSAAQVGDLKAS